MEWDQYPTATMKDINKVAFLDFLSKAEGADYNTIVGGSKFDSYDKHPNVVGLTTKEGPSTAAGRYQITGTTYRDLAPKLGITDFSPGSQDKIALALIDRVGATKDIEEGNFDAAISKLGSTWASLPSSPYSQPKKSQSWANKTLESIVNSMVPAANAASPASPSTSPLAQSSPTTPPASWDSFPQAQGKAAATSWDMFPVASQQGQEPAPQGSVNELGTETVPVAPPTEPTMAPLPTGLTQVPTEQPAAPTEAPMAPQGAPVAPQTTSMPPQQSPSFKDEVMRQLGLTGRYALQGAEKAFTFPVRAVGEAGASLLSLAGAPEAGKAVSGAVGFNAPSVGAQAADIAGLPTPQTGLEKTVGAGAEALAGLGVGGVARAATANAPKVAQELASALFPTANTAGQALAFGSLGSAMEAAPGTTTAGLAALIAAGAGKKAYQGVRTNSAMEKILERAGGRPDLAKVDAEIITAISKERNSYIRDAGKGAPPLGTAALNQTVAGKFVREAEDLVSKLPNDFQGKTEILDKLRTGVNLSTDEVYALRSTKVGDMVADAIQKAQRVYSLTGVTPASGGAAGMATRSAIGVAPLAASAMTGIPVVIPNGVLAGAKRILGGGETRQQAGINITKPYDVKAAQKILAEKGPSISTQSMQQLDDYVSNSIKEAEAVDNRQLAAQMGSKREELMAARQAAQAATTEAEKTAAQKAMTAAEKEILDLGTPIVEANQKVKAALAEQQSKDPSLLLSIADPLNAPRTLKDQKEFARLLKRDIESRMSPGDVKKSAIQKEMDKQVSDEISSKVGYPVGGANTKIFEKFPHLRTPQYKVELETIANDQTLSETLRETAKQLLSNSKTDTGKTAFFGVQDLVLSRLPAGGALSPQAGALSNVNPVRNPTSYNEAVRTAGEAANIARSSAPTPELGQFATTVAGIKSPADKAKALQERLAAATDQTEIDFLNKFVEPITKFGKKGK